MYFFSILSQLFLYNYNVYLQCNPEKLLNLKHASTRLSLHIIDENYEYNSPLKPTYSSNNDNENKNSLELLLTKIKRNKNKNGGFDSRFPIKEEIDMSGFYERNYKFSLLKTLQNKNINVHKKLQHIEHNSVIPSVSWTPSIISAGLFQDWERDI